MSPIGWHNGYKTYCEDNPHLPCRLSHHLYQNINPNIKVTSLLWCNVVYMNMCISKVCNVVYMNMCISKILFTHYFIELIYDSQYYFDYNIVPFHTKFNTFVGPFTTNIECVIFD